MTKIAVLLGAGASSDAGLPTTGQLTSRIADQLKESRGGGQAKRILNFVAGELLAEEGRRGRSVFAGVDVERVLTAIELLATRNDLEISPFVHSWNPQVGAAESPSSMPAFTLKDIKAGIMSSHDRDLERPLRDFVKAVARSEVDDGSAYFAAFDVLQETLVEILADLKDTSYLNPIVDLVQSQGPTTVGTLNYDLAVETAAVARGVTCSTGIESWSAGGELQWGDGLRLLKLHGSIDWQAVVQAQDGGVRQYRVTSAGDQERYRGKPAIIFGGRNKLRAEGPYLELLAEFGKQLTGAGTLVVIGYSFRDDHVNETIRRWVNGSSDRRVIVVDPGFTEHLPHYVPYRSMPFPAELYRTLRETKGQPAIPVQPGGKGREAIPASPSRILVYRARARDALAEAVEAAATSESWPEALATGRGRSGP